MRHFVIVTGASSGIGYRACEVYIQHGYDVIAGVRNDEDASRLTKELGNKLHPVILDVTNDQQIQTAKEIVTNIIGTDGELVAIINNAGVVVNGAVLYIPVEAWQKQFEVNLFGVIRITQAFFPLLLGKKESNDHHPRRIINIGSISGLFASPFLGPYAASKFALRAMSDSLRRELYMYDVQVVLIEAGNIQTRIWEKAKTQPTYFGPEYEEILAFKEAIIDRNIERGMPIGSLDSYLLKSVRAKNVRTRYLVKKGKWQFKIMQSLPTKWIDRIIRKKLQQRSGIRPF